MAKTPAKTDSLVEKIGDGSTMTRDGQSWSTESWDPISHDENLWVLGQHLREEGALFSDPAAAGTSTASSLSTAAVGERMSNTVPWLSLRWSRSRGHANPAE